MQKDLRAGAMTPQPAGKVQHSKAGKTVLASRKFGASGGKPNPEASKAFLDKVLKFFGLGTCNQPEAKQTDGGRIPLMRRRAGEGNQPGRLPERRLHRNGEIARKGVHSHHRKNARSM